MKPEERALLRRYFPEAAVEGVAALYESRRFVLQFNSPRLSKLGDFRPPRSMNGICRITLNCDLHPFQMLITFVHEVAHYDVYQRYKHAVQPHGEEWKQIYITLLMPFIREDIFPKDVIEALYHHLTHVKASSHADTELLKVLQHYEEKPSTLTTVEDLPEGARFILQNGQAFEKGPKQRTRYKCYCLNNGRWYMVAGLAVAQQTKS